MGQRGDDVFLLYISRKSGVDSQAILNGQKPDQPLMDLMQSMVVNLDVEARQGPQLTDIERKGLRRVAGGPIVNAIDMRRTTTTQTRQSKMCRTVEKTMSSKITKLHFVQQPSLSRYASQASWPQASWPYRAWTATNGARSQSIELK